jgi:hypothetical protein
MSGSIFCKGMARTEKVENPPNEKTLSLSCIVRNKLEV